MSEPDKKVECEHGTGIATFVCIHLRDGIACGFHAAEADDDQWPDAWCDRCEVARVRAGGWNDKAESTARISLLCNHCYDEAKERNRRVPNPLVAGTIATSGSVIERLLVTASEAVAALQRKARETFRLDGHERWAADYETGRFTMTVGGEAQIAANMQIVGSFSKQSNSWLWAWANETNEPHLVNEVAELRTLGEVRGISLLEDEYHADVDEAHCWELASLACYLLRYEAVYRAPMDHRYLFFLLKDLRWVS
jgi:hypothetical protein